MHKTGTIVRWNPDRAFGFIRSADTPADVFFHLRDFRSPAPPREGLAVAYEEIHVGGKGPRAMAVQPMQAVPPMPAVAPLATRATRVHPESQRAPRPPSQHTARRPPPPHTRRNRTGDHTLPRASAVPILALTAVWAGLLTRGWWSGLIPLWGLGALVAVNLLTALVYVIDKGAAQQGRWRTQESHLHLLGLAGGWPAAWWAQQALRHKTRKPAFRVTYWATVMMHCTGLATMVLFS